MTVTGNTQTNQPQVNATPGSAAANQEPAVAQPQQQQAAPQGIPAELQELANQKYGGDVTKAIEGLTNAQQKMHEATTRAKDLERKLEELELRQTPQATGHPQQQGFVSDTERARIENEYGKPYEEVMYDMKIAQLASLPALEMSSESYMATVKSDLRSKDPNFTPEVEQRFDTLMRQRHPNDRMIPQIQKSILAQAKGSFIDDIVEARYQAKLKEMSGGEPVQPSPVNKPTNTTGGIPPKVDITDEELRNIASWGGDIEAAKKVFTEGGN